MSEEYPDFSQLYFEIKAKQFLCKPACQSGLYKKKKQKTKIKTLFDIESKYAPPPINAG